MLCGLLPHLLRAIPGKLGFCVEGCCCDAGVDCPSLESLFCAALVAAGAAAGAGACVAKLAKGGTESEAAWVASWSMYSGCEARAVRAARMAAGLACGLVSHSGVGAHRKR